jgi:D-alanyl-D-alanine carboxypeptidase/D-alanyl-D-alanine-endopeptidase (penicillin-binding protein 4)
MAKSIRKGINFPTLFTLFLFLSTAACSVRQAQKNLLADPALKGAHVGVAVYNASKEKWVDRHLSDLYYTPASNTKILSTYLGMRFLGDSIPGWKMAENKDSIFLLPLGDPSFLHPDFTYQPIADLIRQTKKQVVLCFPDKPDAFAMYGKGWSWDDYPEDYQPERNRLNIYGNVLTVTKSKNGVNFQPSLFTKNKPAPKEYTQWSRAKLENQFFATSRIIKDTLQQIPFITDTTYALAKALLEDTLHPTLPIAIQKGWHQDNGHIVKTVPTDSLLKIMMHRSDNFFAEQVFLMASEQVLGTINEDALIDTILKSEFSFFPQPTQWADGSGLSRFNLITPENYVALLKKMENDFSLTRIKGIFAQGGKTSLAAYYKNIPGELYAKTGTLGNQVALSGYIITNKGTRLLFSVLVANHISPSSTPVRKAVEAYLTSIMKVN